MEVEKSYLDRIESFIKDANKDGEIEMEIRFWGVDNKMDIEEEKFKKIFEYYTFSSEYDGLGCEYEMSSNLDITVSAESDNDTSHMSRTRLTIEDTNQIKKYWLKDSLDDIPYQLMEKRRLEMMDIRDYNIRISMNKEIPQEEILEKNRTQLLSNIGGSGGNGNSGNSGNRSRGQLMKFYRLKNRYSIKTKDGLFQIDLTSVKSGKGRNFREANIMKNIATHEVEIEYIGNKAGAGAEVEAKKSVSQLFTHVHTILAIMNDSENIIKESLKREILESYNSLVRVRNETFFGRPITIHRQNLIPDKKVNNIYNHYTVSLKADGLNMALYCYASTNPKLNGNIYLIDINNNIIFSGYKDESYVNTIIEGEYILTSNQEGHQFYTYDILYDRGNDMRRRQYFNKSKGDERLLSRSHFLDLFVHSTSRVEVSKREELVPIRRKNFRYSQLPDGSDIFQRANEIWGSRGNEPFHVDGLIFTPMYEYYPMKGGSWYSLFKWKPTHLNTIDFLISIVKNDAKSEMKFPYVSSDGKIRQYKKIRLYVGSTKDMFDNKTKRIVKDKIKALFNPYGLDDEGARDYNTCYVFIDENDQIICHDPISGEEDVVRDDTIVEFGFDSSREKGFQWIPYRVRYDKTGLYRSGKPVYGNFDKVANDVFCSVQYPVTDEMITTGQVPLGDDGAALSCAPYYTALKDEPEDINQDRLPYQAFHTHYIKGSLFKQVNPAMMGGMKGMLGKILDLGCGKGVDVKKMKTARYAEVVGMDFDFDNIKFAQNYYNTVISKPKPKAYFVRGDAGKLIFPNQDAGFTVGDKQLMQKFIKIKHYFDVVSVQFAMHYFFENEIRLRSFLQNVNDNLNIGGYFIGTCFDGARVYQMLKGSNEIEGRTSDGEVLWKIEKKYTTTRMAFDRGRPNLGKEIDVFVRSIGQPHLEYLVNFEYFDAILEEYGFKKIQVKPFSEYHEELLKSEYDNNNGGENSFERKRFIDNAKMMSEEEKRFSFLNNAFVYQKVSHTPDLLFTKLVKMMEEKVKKEKKKEAATAIQEEENVDILDNETAHLVIHQEEEENVPAASEETVSNGNVLEKTTNESNASIPAASEETASNGNVLEETTNESNASIPAASEETVSNGSALEETTNESNVSIPAASEETVSNGSALEETASNGSALEETVSNGSVPAATMEGGGGRKKRVVKSLIKRIKSKI